MHSHTNNGVFGWGDDRKIFHPSSAPRPHDDSSRVQLHQHHSYAPTGFSPNSSSWSSAAFLGSYPPHWTGDLRIDEAHLGPSFGAQGGNVDVQGTSSLVGMEVAAPITEQAFPFVQRALPAPQHCPQPPPSWTRAPGPAWQPAPSWGHPVHTARQHGGHSGSINSLGMGIEASRLQFAVPSVQPTHSGYGMIPTGHPPLMGTPHSVPPLTQGDPVPVTSERRGERWDLASDTNTFPCLWRSGGTRCTALIAGDRKSMSSHLRDEHGFMCDGQTVACAWGQCSTWMQRRNVPRHIIACHLEIKVNCPHCGIALSRPDARKKHRLACQGIAKAAVEEDDGRLFF